MQERPCSWPTPQPRPHDAPMSDRLIELAALILALGVVSIAWRDNWFTVVAGWLR